MVSEQAGTQGIKQASNSCYFYNYKTHTNAHSTGAISAAQLSPQDEDLCAYFHGGNALLRLHRLSDDTVVQQADLVEPLEGGGGGGAAGRRSNGGKDDESVASGGTGQQVSSSSSSKKQDVRLGLCAFGDGGSALFAVVANRRVLKLDAGSLGELKRCVVTRKTGDRWPIKSPPSLIVDTRFPTHRSPDCIGSGTTTNVQLHKMRMSPSGRLLFVFTNRGTPLVRTCLTALPP